MLSLADLLNSADGIRFLESRGVYVSPETFVDQLQPPTILSLACNLGLGHGTLVYAGQQLYMDYRHSVLGKIALLEKLEQVSSLNGLFIWMDTDRSGSEKAITRFTWPGNGKLFTISIAGSKVKDIELRFVEIAPPVLRKAIDNLGMYLRQSAAKKNVVAPKYERLRALFVGDKVRTLSEFNLQLTCLLLENHLGYCPRWLILSEILNSGLLNGAVDLFINNLEAVIRVFNEAVESLVQRGIDPQVRPLSEHFLPLYYSCEVDDQRTRLYHKVDGSDHYAVGTCKCGVQYRFYLGSRTLSSAEITRTGRWSPDVCLPVFLNDFVSGLVAGKSSALYGLVLNAVLEKALHKQPVPMLVPESLKETGGASDQVDSLIYNYIYG